MNSKSPSFSRGIILGLGLLLAGKLSYNIYRIWKAGDRLQQAQAQLDKLTEDQAQLKKRLAEVNTPEFVEKEAREKLGFGKPGEIILVLPQNEATANPKSSLSPTPNWKKWWDLYVGI
jgi:cell division protein FtsB